MAKRTAVPAGRQRVRVAEGVYLKASGKFLATFRDPGRKQQWKEFRTQREAVRWRAKALVDPQAVLSGKRTLAEVWEELLGNLGENLKPTTRANWEQEWRAHIEPALGTWPVGKITIPVVKSFLAALEHKGAGVATRQKCRSILGRALAEAVENGEISSNPVAVRGTRVKPGQRRKARILTPAEVGRVITAAAEISGESDALAIEAVFCLGLRIGEMAGLQIQDVDLTNHEITIRRTVIEVGGRLKVQDATKTNRFRTLPLPEGLPFSARLEKYVRASQRIGAAPVFASAAGLTLRPNNWRGRIWSRSMATAGIEDPPTPHSGRRTTASLLSAVGVPPATVQAILGHSTLQQTGEYIDVSRTEMRKGLAQLGLLYEGNRTIPLPGGNAR
jgi:integrase